MQGSVYYLSLNDADDAKAHLHVVILGFSGNKDCIVVPAYSVDGPAINDFIEACRKRGMPDREIYVKLDNSKYINFPPGFPPKEAYWCTSRSRRLPQRLVLSSRFINKMEPRGLLLIASGLLETATHHPMEIALSPNAVKSLRNYVKVLAIECGEMDVSEARQEECPPDPARDV
jgi:hypothetical protein